MANIEKQIDIGDDGKVFEITTYENAQQGGRYVGPRFEVGMVDTSDKWGDDSSYSGFMTIEEMIELRDFINEAIDKA